MTNQTQGHTDRTANDAAIIRGDGSAYAVPLAVLEQHRVRAERRAEVEAALPEQTAAGEIQAEALVYELSPEALAPYRLSDEERDALEAEFAGRQADDDTAGFDHQPPLRGEPIAGYTGYPHSAHFGGFVRGVYIGVFPKYQAPSSSGPYPGLR